MNREQTILLVTNDAALSAATRQEFKPRGAAVRIAVVSSADAALRIVAEANPAVILLDETSVILEEGPGKIARLNSVASMLTTFAPVVVLGGADRQMEVAPLIAAGTADFVARAGGCLPVALGLLKRRLRQRREAAVLTFRGAEPPQSEAFGEVLRHELNNPLTGILGNAELLLAEVRRKKDGRLPAGAQERLETVATLAVRLRETVRRLSQEWESRHSANGELTSVREC